MAKVKRRKGNIVTLDFTGVKSGGATVPDGRYTAKIVAAETKVGKESGEPYTALTWEITSKKCNGREVPFDSLSHQPTALWRMKGMLEAMEVEVPDGEHDVDFDELIDDETECIIEVVGEKSSEGKVYARVAGYAPLSDGGTVDDEEDDPKRPKGGTTSGKNSRRSGGSDDEDDEPPRRRRAAKDEEEDEEDDDEPPRRRRAAKEEEDEDDEPPARSTNKRVKKGAKVKFKDEKNKTARGVIDSIDGDMAKVVPDDDEDALYEVPIDELTVIG